MRLKGLHSLVFVPTLFMSLGLFAQSVNETQQATQQALSAAQASFAVLQQQLQKDCVTPTTELECNSSTATMLSTLSGIAGQISSSTAGSTISGTISTVSCQLIKCDTTKLVNKNCNGQGSVDICSTGQAMPPTSGYSDCQNATDCMSLLSTVKTEQNLCDIFPVDIITCPAYFAAMSTCNSSCYGTCLSCETKDNAKFDCKDTCSGTMGYSNCITPYKVQAQERQSKCRKLCASMTATLNTMNTLKNALAPKLEALEEQIEAPGSTVATTTPTPQTEPVATENTDDIKTQTGTTYDDKTKTTTASKSSASKASASDSVDTASGVLATGAGTSSSAKSKKSVEPESANGTVATSEGTLPSGTLSDLKTDEGTQKDLKGLVKKGKTKPEIQSKDVEIFKVVSELYSSTYRRGIIGGVRI